MKNVLILVAAVGLLASCRSTRTISKAVTKKDTTAIVVAPPVTNKVDTQQLIRNALQQLQKNHIGFQTFSGKVNVDYQGTNGKSYSFNANVRMYKDSAIWISANAILGIEAMRVLITKDSVKMLNKLEKTYSPRSVGYLQEVAGLPLSLSTLQDLIVGNPVYLDSNIVRYATGNGVIDLLSLGQFFKNLLTIDATDKVILHSKLDDADPSRNRTADLSYGNYENKRGPVFPTRREMEVSEKGRLVISLDFKNYSLNDPVEFPFSIPKNYKRD